MEATYNYTVKIHKGEDFGYWAEVPALPGCFTQGETVEEVQVRIREAIEGWLAWLSSRGEPIPVERKTQHNFSIPVTVRVPHPA